MLIPIEVNEHPNNLSDGIILEQKIYLVLLLGAKPRVNAPSPPNKAQKKGNLRIVGQIMV